MKTELNKKQRLMVLAIFMSVFGLFIGVAGLIFHWNFAKGIGLLSLIVLGVTCELGLDIKSDQEKL